MLELSFADGLLSAGGEYNFNNNSSSIDFNASHINSNLAARTLFGLENQVEGIACAKIHAETFNNLERLKAKGQFEINDGFLPKLGNTEFMVKKFNMSKKVKISSLTNADLTSADTFRSDINGSLILDNYKLEDIEMTTRHKSFATLLQGSYNIRGQEADINIYGKYDRQAPKGVKILFLPLNWIINFALRNDEAKAFYQKLILRRFNK